MFSKTMTIAGFDDELAVLCRRSHAAAGTHRADCSENYASPRVLEAQGSVLTNKYAEGYPGKRYYGGCEYVDKVETLAIERAKVLFKCGYANVQPHSGSQANTAVYAALLKPGDTLLGMSLAHGGHLTHGASVSFSGRIYNAVQYGLNPRPRIDTRRWKAGVQHKPKLVIAGFSRHPRISTGNACVALPTRLVHCLSWIWRMSRVSSQQFVSQPFPHAHVVTSTHA